MRNFFTFQSACRKVVDKYVEYDIVLIVIDLILQYIGAYRHILLNSKYKVMLLRWRCHFLSICFFLTLFGLIYLFFYLNGFLMRFH